MSITDNPLSAWGNDDLLVAAGSRQHFAGQHPEAFPVFFWPKLVERFEGYDPKANAHRKLTRKWGVGAAGLGFAGLLITALAPVIVSAESGLLSLTFGLLAAVLASASGIIGYWSAHKGPAKQRWLANRFWTERMRQLHFQFIANNLGLAARVLAEEKQRVEGTPDGPERKTWDDLRARVLADFENRLGRSVDEAIYNMRTDLAEDQSWLEPAWLRPLPPPASSDELKEVFRFLREQRFGVQIRYPRLKLKPGPHSSRSRANAVQAVTELLTLGALLLAVATGATLIFVTDMTATPVKLLVAIAGAMTAGVLALRVLDEGLQLKSEAERYEWYLAAVQSLERQFDAADDAGKLAALREMERLSYQELRWFTESFHNARFVL